MVPRSTHRQDIHSSIYNPVADSAEHLPVPVTVGEFSLVETASSLWMIGSCLSNNSDGEIGCGDGCSAKMVLTCRSMSTSRITCPLSLLQGKAMNGLGRHTHMPSTKRPNKIYSSSCTHKYAPVFQMSEYLV